MFDLDYSRQNIDLNYEQVIVCFKDYTLFGTGKKPPSKKEFLMNIQEKENSAEFIGDMEGLLRPEVKYSQSEAFDWLKTELIAKI
ncbi:MAG: hypothetical protein WBP08_11480 [Saprospiraceae bacterium]